MCDDDGASETEGKSYVQLVVQCLAISANEWLKLFTATTPISPDPMLLICRSDLNLNIFMCMMNSLTNILSLMKMKTVVFATIYLETKVQTWDFEADY